MAAVKKMVYTAEFRAEAVRLILEKDLSVSESAQRLGIPKQTLIQGRSTMPIFSSVVSVKKTEEKTGGRQVALKRNNRQTADDTGSLKRP